LAQIICSTTGSVTNATTQTSLGSCAVPPGILRSGDRVEVLFDYYHQGAGTGFQFQVLWGATPVVSRATSAGIPIATGRVIVGISSTNSQWSVQSWGSGLGVAADAGSMASSLSSPLTIDFRGWMLAATSDTVALRNLTVVRYPAP
jgi:hypothetical protein